MGYPFIRKVTDEHGFEMDAYHSKDEHGWMWMPVDHEFYWSGSITEFFDPMNRIEHAWMVEYEIEKMDVEIREKYGEALSDGYSIELGLTGTDIFWIAHASPEQRSCAAVRALGTDEEIGRLLPL